MKLLAVSHTGLLSGAERVLLEQLVHFRSIGHEVVLAGGPGPLLEQAVGSGISTVPLPELKPGGGPRPIALAGLASAHLRAARPIRRLADQADLVLFNSALALPSTLGVRLDRPTVLVVHDVLIRADRKAILRGFARVVDRAIAVSDAAAAYPRSLGIDTVTVRNGARFSPRDPDEAVRGAADDPPIIGIVGALTPWKGHAVLLEALALIPDVHLEVLGQPFPGDVAHAAALERRSEAADLAGRVQFLGHREDVAAVMERWSVSVSASIEPEAGPLVVLESMALAIPVVGTDLGGTSEILDGAGLLVPPDDAAALAGAIERLLSDRDLAMRCRTAGVRAIEHGLTLAHSLAAISAELERLVTAD